MLNKPNAEPDCTITETDTRTGPRPATWTARMEVRIRAIASALWFGTLPWWVYEPKPHENYHSYSHWLSHLVNDYCYVAKWITFRETDKDWEFEAEVNPAPQRWFRFGSDRVAAGKAKLRFALATVTAVSGMLAPFAARFLH